MKFTPVAAAVFLIVPFVHADLSIEIKSFPEGASVELDGRVCEGKAPMEISVDEATPHKARITLEGYEPKTYDIVSIEKNAVLSITHVNAYLAPTKETRTKIEADAAAKAVADAAAAKVAADESVVEGLTKELAKARQSESDMLAKWTQAELEKAEKAKAGAQQEPVVSEKCEALAKAGPEGRLYDTYRDLQARLRSGSINASQYALAIRRLVAAKE